MRAPFGSSWWNFTSWSLTALWARTPMLTSPNVMDPFHTARAMATTLPGTTDNSGPSAPRSVPRIRCHSHGSGEQNRVRSEVGEVLLEAEQGSEQVAGGGDVIGRGRDRPAIGAQVGVVEVVPRDRHRH